MTIAYLEPLRRGYHRMVEILFRPFDLTTWVIVGFGCWLARLTSGGYGGAGTSWSAEDWNGVRASRIPDEISEGIREITHRLPQLLVIVGCVLLVLLVLAVVLLWLSSRGQFLFLDNVLRRRPAVREPWKEFRREGNSLFLWRLGFVVAAIFGMLLAALPGTALLLSGDEDHIGRVFAAVVLLLVPLLLLGIALAYVQLFLVDFVVPLMYRHRLTTTQAWGRFLQLFKAEPVHFLLYGLFVLLLSILVAICLVIAILATCCVAGVLLAIPYLGTLLLLPIHVIYRAFSLEYLAQFGPEADPFQGIPEPVTEGPSAAPSSSGEPAPGGHLLGAGSPS